MTPTGMVPAIRGSRAVCLFCRPGSARLPRRSNLLLRLRKATVSSLSKQALARNSITNSNEKEEGEEEEEERGEGPSGTAFTAQDPRKNEAGRQENRLRGRFINSQSPRTPVNKPNSSNSMAIFQKLVQKQAPGIDDPRQTPVPPHNNLQLYEDNAKLGEMIMSRNGTPSSWFQFFENKIYPEIVRTDSPSPQLTRRTTENVMNAVTTAKIRDIASQELPTVARISQIWVKLEQMQPDRWASLVSVLLEHLCSLSTSPQDYPSIESYDASHVERENLLRDLILSWKIFTFPKVMANLNSASYASAEFRLPATDHLFLKKYARRKDLATAIAALFPQYAPNQLRQSSVTALAIATYFLLSDSKRSRQWAKEEARPFLAAMHRVLTTIPVDAEVIEQLTGANTPLSVYIKRQFTLAFPSDDLSAMKRKSTHTYNRIDPKMLRQGDTADLHEKLGQALNRRDVTAVDQLWSIVWSKHTRDAAHGQPRDSPQYVRLLDYFIYVYMAVRQHSKAIAVLEALQGAGWRPTLKTYTSMMEGCKRSRNAAGIANIWSKLVSARVPLDTAIWTSRISGLIHAGAPDEGLKALHEMVQHWQGALKSGDTATAVKPTIGPVNAALAGLLDSSGIVAARRVLGWAASQGIEPDVITYNTLLRHAVHNGTDNEAGKILEVMKQQRVQADATTFTIILQGAMSGIGGQSSKEQVALVNQVLTEMEDAGVPANMFTYAKIIHILLEEGEKNEDSVKAVLSHIWAKGLELSPHIYTILLNHYFHRDPPDLDAVRVLIERRRLFDKPDTDRVLFERVIRGFMRAGDPLTALELFDKVKKVAHAFTMPTLIDVLRALIKNASWENASQLVRTVHEHNPQQQDGDMSSRHARSAFWKLAAEYGLPFDEARQSLQADSSSS